MPQTPALDGRRRGTLYGNKTSRRFACGTVTTTSGSSNGVSFTLTANPAILSLSQTAGPVGTAITISGINFGSSQGSSTITFAGTAATPTSWSATSIMAPVPSGASSGNVIVTVASVPSNGANFTITSGPGITALYPLSGAVGDSITIVGTGFGSTQGSSTVSFNGTTASPTNWSATSITALVPNGATTGNVVVTVGGAGSNGVGFSVGEAIYYYFSDSLGTARVITNSVGTVCYDADMYPYGGERAYVDTCDSAYKFTGKERDSESGLDDFGARYDSSQYGRFMTPDLANIAGDLDESGNPQSWNAYSYVQNNPVNAVDPDGNDCVFTQDDAAYVARGDCNNLPKGAQNATYVAGTVDEHSGQYNSSTGTLSFSYTPYSQDAGGSGAAIGRGFISGLNPSSPDNATALASAVNAMNPGGFINGSARLMAENGLADGLGKLAGLGVEALLAARAAKVAEVAVDVDNLSNKIVRQMVSRGWNKQEIIDTVRNGKAFDVVNKATGGPATEYVSSSGKFVVVDNSTKQVIQVSGPGFSPNHLIK
jgi:RHS repeat-associated protein